MQVPTHDAIASTSGVLKRIQQNEQEMFAQFENAFKYRAITIGRPTALDFILSNRITNETFNVSVIYCVGCPNLEALQDLRDICNNGTFKKLSCRYFIQ